MAQNHVQPQTLVRVLNLKFVASELFGAMDINTAANFQQADLWLEVISLHWFTFTMSGHSNIDERENTFTGIWSQAEQSIQVNVFS
jgi:hypothetical protein